MLQWKTPRFLALVLALAGLSALLGSFEFLLRNFGW
jgi:hypothetical protein